MSHLTIYRQNYAKPILQYSIFKNVPEVHVFLLIMFGFAYLADSQNLNTSTLFSFDYNNKRKTYEPIGSHKTIFSTVSNLQRSINK